MKNFIKKLRELTLFAKLMIIYVIILVAVIIGICMWEWNSLKDYQNDYDLAKENSNPELFVQEYVEGFNEDEYEKILLESISSDNMFYTKELLVEQEMKNYVKGQIRSERNGEKYTEYAPAYDIYSGDKLIMTIKLGVASKDNFGFNRWKVGTIELNTYFSYNERSEFIIDSNMKATINGVEVPETYVKEYCDEKMTKKATELLNEEYSIKKYCVTGLMEGYVLEIYDRWGNELTGITTDNGNDFTILSDDNRVYTNRINKLMEAYIKYTNKHMEIDDMLAFTRDGSNAGNIVSLSEEPLSWNTKPEKLEIKSCEIKNIRLVSDDLISCYVKYDIFKTYKGNYVSDSLSEETVKYNLFLRCVNGVWLLEDMYLE